jgi:general secretion pathway protein E
VITIEDPVEVTFEGLSQIQIRPSVGLTFARCIRSAMRQDPDVLLVGELRDLEMMNLCAQVALTGHLVLTTLHAQTCAGAIRRLIDCGLEPFLINSTLQGVVSPRLVRMLCPKCRRPAEPARHSLSPEAARIVAGLAAPTFYEPVGCEHCSGTGYRGRTSIYEILAMDERIRQTVTAPADMAAICNAARASGMKTMLADGLEKAARGVTSIREVVRVVPPESGA